MSKRESLKEQLKKAAKRRSARNSALNQTSDEAQGAQALDNPATADLSPSLQPHLSSPLGSTSQSLNVIVEALLELDRIRDDLNDRTLMVGLKSVLRGYPGNDAGAAAVYRAVVEAKKRADIQPHPLRSAIDELLEIVMAYGSERQTTRSALTYLHSIAS